PAPRCTPSRTAINRFLPITVAARNRAALFSAFREIGENSLEAFLRCKDFRGVRVGDVDIVDFVSAVAAVPELAVAVQQPAIVSQDAVGAVNPFPSGHGSAQQTRGEAAAVVVVLGIEFVLA